MLDREADALPETQDEYEQSYTDYIVESERKHMEQMEACDDSPPPPGVRLREKTTPQASLQGKTSGKFAPLLPTFQTVDPPQWLITKKARCHYAAKKARARGKDDTTYDDAFRAAYKEWALLRREVRETLTTEFLANVGADSSLKVSVPYTNLKAPDVIAETSLSYSCGSLQTWNGPWFLDDDAYVKMVNEWHAIPHILEKQVLAHPGIQELFNEFRSMILQACLRFKLREWSACLEISLQAKDLGRLHLHCFLERNCREDHAWAMWSTVVATMRFRGVKVGHNVPAAVKCRGRNRARALTEGHYYCQAEKLGQVMNDSSVPKFQKTFPDSRMITALWRHRKMSTSACKTEVLLSRDKAPSTLAMLDATMALEYSTDQETDAGKADSSWKKCPFKEPSDLELEWVRQHGVLASKPTMRQYRAYDYNSLQDIIRANLLRRLKFLIYDGRSRMGKTELACSWFGTSNTLICNAQDCMTPNLRPLHSGRYSVVLFDEGNWRLCYHNKTMMQASPRPVELGQSQCNDRSYSVLLFRVPLIVCSNDFWEGCDDQAARDWVELNSIYVRIDQEVWLASVVS